MFQSHPKRDEISQDPVPTGKIAIPIHAKKRSVVQILMYSQAHESIVV